MPAHDIIVVGASAGGIEALQQLVHHIPESIPAAIFVVIHLSARSRSFLPEILTKAGRIPALHPENNAPIEYGKVYVAPPGRHLVIERDHVHITLGPKEQHHRPCINVTLRSAALSHGARTVGVILTGELDDGTAGLWEVKRRGGVAIVQNPEEAAFPSMPLSALREVAADYVSGISEIGPQLAQLAGQDGTSIAFDAAKVNTMPKLTDLTCPDCQGTIWEVPQGNSREFRCRVGHTFSPRTMLTQQFAAQERALYSAIVALEEGTSLMKRLADQFEPSVRDKLVAQAQDHLLQAETLKRILRERRLFNLD